MGKVVQFFLFLVSWVRLHQYWWGRTHCFGSLGALLIFYRRVFTLFSGYFFNLWTSLFGRSNSGTYS